jgi:hypothetical protein
VHCRRQNQCKARFSTSHVVRGAWLGQSAVVRLRRSSLGGHYRRDGCDPVKDASGKSLTGSIRSPRCASCPRSWPVGPRAWVPGLLARHTRRRWMNGKSNWNFLLILAFPNVRHDASTGGCRYA